MTTIGSNFHLKDQLGKGGFSTVYRAFDEDGKEVAVKICENTKNGIDHLMELSIMATINHPNVNRALKIYSKGSKLYIFQDLAKDDMSKYVRNDKNPTTRKTPEILRSWMCAIISGLYCLHNLNIIHADIKSSNVLIFNDTDVRLSDFTVSLKLWDSDCKYTTTVGTSTHRAPENFLGREWTKALDIWSLGITLFEVVYGELIFPYQGDFEDRKAHLSERCINCFIDWANHGPIKQQCNIIPNKYEFHKFVLPGNFKDDPYKLNDIILKMLRVNPNERPTISEIANHPFFSGRVNINHIITSPTKYHMSGKDVDFITSMCVSYGMNTAVINLSLELYSRIVKDLDKYTVKSKIKGCIFIASKIITRKPPKNMKISKKILDIERDICSFLKYHVHI